MIKLFCYLGFFSAATSGIRRLFALLMLFFLALGIGLYNLREIYFYNLPGSVAVFNGEIFEVLCLLTPLFFIRPRIRTVKKLTNAEVIVFFALQLIGTSLMTNFFRVIPLFQTNVDAGRALVHANTGAGIGWLLLVFPGTLLILDQLTNWSNSSQSKWVKLLMFVFPFLLYGGRSLMIFPFFAFYVYSLSSSQHRIKVGKAFAASILGLVGLVFFGVWRELGSVELTSESLAWVVVDLGAEYRSGVNVLNNLGFQRIGSFWQNLLSGQIPGVFWGFVDEDKANYYHPIGEVVTSNSHYFKEFDGGMRLGLLGELAISTMFSRVVIIAFMSLMFFATRFMKGTTAAFVLTCVLFAVPYGINFLMNGLQVMLYSLVIWKAVEIIQLTLTRKRV